MTTELHTISSVGNKDLPAGTEMKMALGRYPGTVTVSVKLPEQSTFKTFENQRIEDGILTLPVPLVFLCHASEDKPAVKKLSDRLWGDCFLTWLDSKDLLPGDEWEEVIEATISKSDFIVVFVSPNSVDKVGFVQREIEYALEQSLLRPSGTRYILPVMLEECELPRKFRKLHCLKLSEENSYEKLVKALRSEGA